MLGGEGGGALITGLFTTLPNNLIHNNLFISRGGVAVDLGRGPNLLNHSLHYLIT